ncbi:hypothetical protein ACFQ2A_03415 [Variovorax dokdonensis]
MSMSPGRWAAPALLAALAPCAAQAQSSMQDTGAWRYGLSVYGYFPSVGGSTSAPTSAGGPSLNVDAGKVIDALKFAFMTSFDAHNGRYGVFTDFIYLDLGGSKANSRDFSIGDTPVSGSTSANLKWDLKGILWTVAGQYRVPTDPSLRLDLLGGVRAFWLKPSLGWSIQGDLQGIASGSRTGQVQTSETLWDGIVGAKGRWTPGGSGPWSVPFYLDLGTGESKLTWQAALGVSYGFSWGEITGMWRYVSYDMKSGGMLQDLNFNGPMVGATLRW